MSKTKVPQLNKSRAFPTNMTSAHELMFLAKQGKKAQSGEGKRYAIPAFNVTNCQGIDAAIEAFNMLGSSGILAFSNSALKHMGRGDAIKGLEIVHEYVKLQARYSSVKIATHLDHGDYLSDKGRKVVQAAVTTLTSVMADNSTDHTSKKGTLLAENIAATREVVEMAHPVGVSVEGELGVLAGVEDEETQSEHSSYTDPKELEQFLRETGVLMLAPTIGTMHGPNKGKPGEKVKLNIKLAMECLQIANKINPEIAFVAHGASTLYSNVIDYATSHLKDLGAASEKVQVWKNFVGTDWDQIAGLIENGFCKINTDTENRQAYLASLIGAIKKDAAKIDIRHYDTITYKALLNSYIQKLIMANNYGVWHAPKIDLGQFKFEI